LIGLTAVRDSPANRRVLQDEDGFDGPVFLAKFDPNIAFAVRGQSSPPVTAVTARDAFGVDLTFVQTYSQAQGDV
jgi:hypothetical protein